MLTPTYTLLYVDDPAASGEFYRGVFEREPVESSPTFVLFTFENGCKLGLWSRHTAEPAPTAAGGGSDVGFALEKTADVDRLHEVWSARGLTILQKPTDMDFGRSFVACDPDGHRLRVFALTLE